MSDTFADAIEIDDVPSGTRDPGRAVGGPATPTATVDEMLGWFGLNKPKGATNRRRPSRFDSRGTYMIKGGGPDAIRRAWENRPTMKVEAERIRAMIEAEQRDMVEAALPALSLTDDGLLRFEPDKGKPQVYGLGPAAYGALAARGPALHPPLKYNLNAWLLDQPANAVPARLRTHQPKGAPRRTAFACVGPRYTPRDIDWFAERLAACMPSTAHVRTHYAGDGGDWRIDVSLFSPKEAVAVLGNTFDPHEFGLSLTGNDSGRAANKLCWYALRQVCTNGLVMRAVSSVGNSTWRHIGNPERIEDSINEALLVSGKALDAFGAMWRRATTSYPIDEETGEPIDAAEALVRLAVSRRIQVTGANVEETARALLTSWDQERGAGTDAVINAVTRASWQWQPSQWADTESELEERAGQLLYARVLTVPAMDDQSRAAVDDML